jgi:hypothetical protein
MIIITRPKSNASTYLYNTILKSKKWKKVTLMVQEDPEMLGRLDSHGIEYIKLDGQVQSSPDNSLVKEMYEALVYLDGILAKDLTDEQMMALDDSKLKMVSGSIEKAKRMV